MKTKALREVLERVESRPKEAQEELAAIAREMEASLDYGTYQATAEELAGIDRGLESAREDRFATDDDVEAVLAKHQPGMKIF